MAVGNPFPGRCFLTVPLPGIRIRDGQSKVYGVVSLKMDMQTWKWGCNAKKWICRPGDGVVRQKMDLQPWECSCKVKKWIFRPGNGVVRQKNGFAHLKMEFASFSPVPFLLSISYLATYGLFTSSAKSGPL
jgi:hypothetical protein